LAAAIRLNYYNLFLNDDEFYLFSNYFKSYILYSGVETGTYIPWTHGFYENIDHLEQRNLLLLFRRTSKDSVPLQDVQQIEEEFQSVKDKFLEHHPIQIYSSNLIFEFPFF
jgi:hypothetical protein